MPDKKIIFYFMVKEDYVEEINSKPRERITLDIPRQAIDSEFAYQHPLDLSDIDNITTKEIYPLGTLFSKTVRLLTKIYLNPKSSIQSSEDLKKWSETIITTAPLKQHSIIFDSALFHSLLHTPHEWERTQKVLNYITACSIHPDLFTLHYLADFSETVPVHLISSENIYLHCYGKHLENFDPENIYAELTKSPYPVETSNKKKKKQTDGVLKTAPYQRGFQRFRSAVSKNNKTHPNMHSYEISSWLDLLLASMREFFRYNKIIKCCEHCKGIFVPLGRSDAKYCNYPSPENSKRTCKEQVKYEQKKRRSNPLIQKLYDSRRITLFKQIDSLKNPNAEEDYNQFIKQYHDLMKKLSANEITEEDVYKWFEPQYKRKGSLYNKILEKLNSPNT